VDDIYSEQPVSMLAGVVLSICTESVSWLAGSTCAGGIHFFVYHKCELTPAQRQSLRSEIPRHLRPCLTTRKMVSANGKAALTYFTHIAQHYEALPALNVFLKAKAKERWTRLQVRCFVVYYWLNRCFVVYCGWTVVRFGCTCRLCVPILYPPHVVV
jgi:hypothetical protein